MADDVTVGDMTVDDPDGEGGAGFVRRRTIVAGAAWSIPAVLAMSESPAFASSGDVLTLASSGMQVLADGASVVTATVKSSTGAARSGQVVSFTGSSGATFSPTSGTTDGWGNTTTNVDLNDTWKTPGSIVSLTGVAGSITASQAFTVFGANAYGTGMGSNGEFGDGSTDDRSTPAQLPLVFPSPIVQVASGQAFSLVLLQDGTVWSAGDNVRGQLGDGTNVSRATWAKIPSLSGVSQIAAGGQHAYALVGGSMKAWGLNYYGQVGDGSTTIQRTPVQVSGLTSGVSQIAAGQHTGYALVSGSVKAWGYNSDGELGDGSRTNSAVPVQVSGLTSGVSQIAAGMYSAYALVSGSVKAWGYNTHGEVGNGTRSNQLTPVQVSGLTSGVSQIAAGSNSAYAVVSGVVKAWGSNSNGQLGDGSTKDRSTPGEVSGLTSGVSQIAAGQYSGYALVSGVVQAWGSNAHGQLGDDSNTDRSTPAPVTEISAVSSLAGNGPLAARMFFIR